MGFLNNNKEKEVQEALEAHLEAVCETIHSMNETIRIYLSDDIEKASDSSYQTHLLESKADGLRRQMIGMLYKGAFIPVLRENIVRYIALQDRIADVAESCCDLLISQRPKVIKEFQQDILALAETSCHTLEPLKAAAKNLFIDYDKVAEGIKEVNAEEEKADTIEWHLTENVFSSDKLNLAEKMHLRELIVHIVRVSDVIEDAADMLDVLILKTSIS